MTVGGRDLATEEGRREAAADWLLRLDQSNVSESEMQAWLEWFGASEENRRAFEEMQALYLRMRSLPGGSRERLHDLAQPDLTKPTPGADVAGTTLPCEGNDGIAPRGNRARAYSTFTPRGPWAMAASVAVLAVAAVAAWKMSTPSGENEPVVYTAPADRHRTVHLNDGSELALAADAVVAVNFSDALRAVALERGQTYFEVEKDAGRPFVVHAGDVRVTAVGTAFNIIRSEQAVTVTVTEGAVEVARIVVGNEIATPVRVSMGEKKVIAFSGSTEGDVRAMEPGAGTAWRNGRVEFTGAPLADVLPLVNEYAPRTLVIDDPRVADLVYSGTILQQHVGEWIDSLPRIFPVRQVALADGTTTLVMDSGER